MLSVVVVVVVVVVVFFSGSWFVVVKCAEIRSSLCHTGGCDEEGATKQDLHSQLTGRCATLVHVSLLKSQKENWGGKS